MFPVASSIQTFAAGLWTNTATIAATPANKIAVITAPYAESQALVLADLTLATDHGLAPISGVAGLQAIGADPLDNQYVTTIKDPAGGWRWTTSGVFPPSITVYGFALVDDGLTTLLATKRLNPPLVLTASGQNLDAGITTIKQDATQIH